MDRVSLQSGRWEAECLPADGGRLSVLRFAGHDLLTRRPVDFRPPTADWGRYESRPVYGYDDCFPTVDACAFPSGRQWTVPDHGELCWLEWHAVATGNSLDCTAGRQALPVRFRRRMLFGESSLQWEFELVSEADLAIPFLHVMHGLMPLEEVACLDLPEFSALFDEMNDHAMPPCRPGDVAERLLSCREGTAQMLLLRQVKSGRFEVGFSNGMRLRVEYPLDMFPTLGIWWNRGGYPDEDGCRRVECAVEPIPGTASSLARSYGEGVCLSLGPRETSQWTIVWEIEPG